MVAINMPSRRSEGKRSLPPLTMEQEMLLRTLAENRSPMSAFELTNHWTPTWSLQEVNKFLHDLVQLGHVQFEGRETKVYSVADLHSDKKVSSR